MAKVPNIGLPKRRFKKNAASENDIIFVVHGTDMGDVAQENLKMVDELVSVNWTLTLVLAQPNKLTLKAVHDNVAGFLLITPDGEREVIFPADGPLSGSVTITITDPNTAGGNGEVVTTLNQAVVYTD